MTDPRIPIGPPEPEPAGPIPPEHDEGHEARQLAHALTAGAWEDTSDDDC
jgi:hypothetical protein